MNVMLLLLNKSNVPIVLQMPNGFHKNLTSTVDTFENKQVHLLDLLRDQSLWICFIHILILFNMPIVTVACYGN